MLVTQGIDSLINGVSQQPANMRLPSQCEVQTNCHTTIAAGLEKRPPSNHLAEIISGTLGTAFLGTINRDVDDRYDVVITNGGLQVFDAETGEEQTVSAPQGMSYLDTLHADTNIAMVTVADWTFIVNKGKKVTRTAMSAGDGIGGGGPLNIDAANYVVMNPNDTIADDLPYPYTFLTTTIGVVQAFENLPGGASPAIPGLPSVGDLWHIAGNESNSFSGYWVVRAGAYWEETCSPVTGMYALNALTMPHALVHNSDGTFTFAPIWWKPSKIGDFSSQPPPSFVNKEIADIFFIRNRLGFLSGENVILSCAGDFNNFWRNTATELLDSDVIDVSVTHTEVSNLNFAVPYVKDLILTSDQTQFVLTGDPTLTPSTASITPTTGYPVSEQVRPVLAGDSVYMVCDNGAYSQVREYYVAPYQQTNTADDITAHVPRYLPAGLTKLAASTNYEMLFALTPNQPNVLWVYKYFWKNEQEMQQCWGKWVFDSDTHILNMQVLDNYLHMVVKRNSGVFIEKINLQSGAIPEDGATGFQIYLDRQAAMRGTYDSPSNTTQFILPYAVISAEHANVRLVTSGQFSTAQGALIDPATYAISTDGTTGYLLVTVPGDYSGHNVYCGMTYTMDYQFSEQFVRKQYTHEAITTGSLLLRTISLFYTNTAYLQTSVDAYGNGNPDIETIIPSELSTFTGKTLGESQLLVGSPTFSSGIYQFQIYGRSTDALISIQNDSHLGCNIGSAEWEGFYTNRARPM